MTTRYKTAAGRKCAKTMRGRNRRKRIYYDAFQRNLRKLWDAKGISLEEVAARTEMPMGQVESYYYGPIRVGGPWAMCINNAFALCHVLGCTLDELGGRPSRDPGRRSRSQQQEKALVVVP